MPEEEVSLYQHIFEQAPIGIMQYTREGVITECNNRLAEILGSSLDKMMGLNLLELPDPKLREAVQRALKGEIGIYEGMYKAATSGKSVPVRAEFHPIKKYENGLESGIGMVQDISERYYTNQRLKESEERYRTIFTNSKNVMLLIDIDTGQIRDTNLAAENFYGWTHEELTKMRIHEINMMSMHQIRRQMERAKENGTNLFHFKHKLANGEIRDVEVFSGMVIVDGEHYLHSVINDITERKEAEENLKKFKLGIERSSNIVFITDIEGTIEYVNPSFTQVYGYTYEEAVGANPRLLKSGLVDDEQYTIFWDLISSGDVVEGEIINKTKEGKLLDMRSSANPIVDDNDNIIGYLAIQEDVTEQKEKDVQLHESLKEKEVLLSEIHHRVKNNLAIISGLLELNMYQDEIDDTEKIIKDSQLRIKAMADVHELLYESDNFSSISFSNYIERLIDTNYKTYESGNFNLEFKKHIDEINLNVNQAIPCGLIINELISNALKHAFKGQKSGIVEINLIKKGAFVKLTVEDNGTGVPEEVELMESNSLGITLIKILSQQLQGELEMGNSEKGFKTSLIFEPVKNLRGSSTTYF